MGAESAVRKDPNSDRQQRLQWVAEILASEAEALAGLSQQPPASFPTALEILERTAGNIVVTGMGKAGLIGNKLAATFSSTGTASHFLHPAEAVHGDLGRVQSGDVVLALSYSGETEEIVRLMPVLASIPVPIIAITASCSSSLGRQSSIVLELGRLDEACHLGLAPSTTTTAMLAVGDALALVLARIKNQDKHDFARSHPAGNLGRRLAPVTEVMRPLDQCRIAADTESVRQVFVAARVTGRRSGAVMLVNQQGTLTGLFTDSDLARLLEQKQDQSINQPVARVMTENPITISAGALMPEAVQILAQRRISELPVVNQLGQPAGMLDITDLVEWLPPAARVESSTSAPATGTDLPPTVPFTRAQKDR